MSNEIASTGKTVSVVIGVPGSNMAFKKEVVVGSSVQDFLNGLQGWQPTASDIIFVNGKPIPQPELANTPITEASEVSVAPKHARAG